MIVLIYFKELYLLWWGRRWKVIVELGPSVCPLFNLSSVFGLGLYPFGKGFSRWKGRNIEEADSLLPTSRDSVLFFVSREFFGLGCWGSGGRIDCACFTRFYSLILMAGKFRSNCCWDCGWGFLWGIGERALTGALTAGKAGGLAKILAVDIV